MKIWVAALLVYYFGFFIVAGIIKFKKNYKKG